MNRSFGIKWKPHGSFEQNHKKFEVDHWQMMKNADMLVYEKFKKLSGQDSTKKAQPRKVSFKSKHFHFFQETSQGTWEIWVRK